MKNKKHSKKIIYLLAFFMITMLTYSTAQIMVEQYFLKKIKKMEDVVTNQQSKNKLGRIINENIILLKLLLNQIINSNNKYELKSLNEQIKQHIENIKKLLFIIQKGGLFTQTLLLNLDKKDQIQETIKYYKSKEDQDYFVIEVINILPAIDSLTLLFDKINNSVNSERTERAKKPPFTEIYEKQQNNLKLYYLQAATLLSRCHENSNKIFFDTSEKLNNLNKQHNLLIHKYNLLRKYLYISLQLIILSIFIIIFIRINKILILSDETENEKQKLLANLQNSNEIFEEIIINMPVGIVLISQHKEIIQMNAEAERILGYNLGEGNNYLIGKRCHQNYCSLEENACPIFDKKQKKVILKERSAIKKDGTLISILKSVIPINLHGQKVLLEAFMDLSAIKNAEKAILEAKEAAETANKSKSDFLANMSHEIRTPMNAIIGFSNILLETEKNVSRERKLSMISQSANALLNLINEILDFSKIEAGKIHLEKNPFSIPELLHKVSSMVYMNTIEKDLQMECKIAPDTPEYAIGDEFRLNQILVNLTGNAIKFTQKGKISITADYKKPFFIIKIQDTGIGINEKNIKHIFNAFEQADSSMARRYGGTGLGLSISLSLIRMMEGHIDVKSKENEGTTFTISVPMEVAHPQTKHQIQSESSEIFQKHIIARKALKCLVAEDNHVNSKLTQTYLKDMNISSDSAENGEIALSMILENNYDFILMDMHMPIMNGIKVLKELKQKKSYPPVVAITADAIKGSRQKYLEAGCTDYISKPFTRHDIQITIYKLFPHIFELPEDTKETEELYADNESLQSAPLNFEPMSPLEIKKIKKTIHILKENSSIFNPDELESIANELAKYSEKQILVQIAENIKNAADSFEDTALENIIKKLKTLLNYNKKIHPAAKTRNYK